MAQLDDSDPRATSQKQPTSELVKQLSAQLSHLVRAELKVAQAEMTSKGKQAGLGIGMLSTGGVLALYGVACLLACAVIALAGVVAAWLAALIVGAAVLAVAAGVGLAGKGRVQKATPPVPQQAVESIHADVEEIKEKAHR